MREFLASLVERLRQGLTEVMKPIQELELGVAQLGQVLRNGLEQLEPELRQGLATLEQGFKKQQKGI